MLYESKTRFNDPTQYNDIFWAIFFYIHVFIILTVAIALGAKYHATSIPINSTFTISSHYYAYGFGSLAIGLLAALFWILLIRKFARLVVWTCVLLSALAFIIVSIYMFSNKSTAGGVIFFILFILNCAYIYYIRNRIEFSVVLLETAVEYINQYPASIYTGLGFLAVQAVWVLIWFFALIFTVATFVIDHDNCVNQSGNVNSCTYGGLNIALFFFMISLYWGSAVIMNVVHTTVAGSFASWYFLYPTQGQENPTWKSMMRALTTSFGSICFGSFIVAVIKTIKSILRSASRSSGSCISACAYCIISCIDSILNLFNTYAYTYIAIYGLSYCEAGKEVYNLMNVRGIDTIVNEDITLTVLNCGTTFGGFVTGVFTYGLASGYKAGSNEMALAVTFGVFAGMLMTACVMEVLHSCVAAFFVCYAEDPQALSNTKPEIGKNVNDAWAIRWSNI